MQAQKTTDSTVGAMVGASMLGKLNLPGVGGNAAGNAGGGYQPRMFGAGRANPNTTGNAGELSDQSGVSSRSSYATRFGAANPQSNTGSNVAQSMEFGTKPKFLTGSMTDTFGPGSNQKQEDSKSQHFSTPNKTSQAKMEDMDEPNLDQQTPDEPDRKPIP